MKKNILLVLLFLIIQNVFSQTGGRRFFSKNFNVNNVTLLELTDDLGQSLNVNNIYKIQLVTTATGTKSGAEYLVWNNLTNTQWQIRAVNLTNSISNHPLLIVDNNIVKVYTKHTTKYVVSVFVEEIITTENDVLPSIFGASFQWQREAGLLYYTDGNVGIGTTTPNNKLDVNGTIHAREVQVDLLNWPDYVFKKEYKLPTLKEVEAHINDKGYLINMPSEAEVLKNGINLGEMNAKLLQKIEELTLYMIDVNKKVEELQTSNSKLSEDNKVLESKIQNLEEEK